MYAEFDMMPIPSVFQSPLSISFQFSIKFQIDDEFNKVKEIGMIVGITVGSILLLLILVTLIVLGIAVARLVHKRYVNIINFVFACQ